MKTIMQEERDSCIRWRHVTIIVKDRKRHILSSWVVGYLHAMMSGETHHRLGIQILLRIGMEMVTATG
jgi:hypothetical protein